MSLLSYIPVDVVEIVVVFTRCRNTLKSLKRIIHKLKEESVEYRIRRKMCDVIQSLDSFYYTDSESRVYYDKPYLVSCYENQCSASWYRNSINVCRSFKNLPIQVDSNQRRVYSNITLTGTENYFKQIVTKYLGHGRHVIYETDINGLRTVYITDASNENCSASIISNKNINE